MTTKKSYARVTFCLDILRKVEEGRDAGFHELCAVKHEISLYDTIRVMESRSMKLTSDLVGMPIGKENTCMKAAMAVKKRFGIRKCVEIGLEKRIPMEGGLAGGSSNAAGVIELLDDLWGLRMDIDTRMAIGREVGRDVPYFFLGGTAIDDEMAIGPVPLLTGLGFTFLLVFPSAGVSTREAYRMIDYHAVGLDQALTRDLINGFRMDDELAVMSSLHNDFERQVFAAYPLLARMKKHLCGLGCPTIMSGSGSTMVALIDPSQEERLKEKIPWECQVVHSR